MFDDDEQEVYVDALLHRLYDRSIDMCDRMNDDIRAACDVIVRYKTAIKKLLDDRWRDGACDGAAMSRFASEIQEIEEGIDPTL